MLHYITLHYITLLYCITKNLGLPTIAYLCFSLYAYVFSSSLLHTPDFLKSQPSSPSMAPSIVSSNAAVCEYVRLPSPDFFADQITYR